MQHREQPDSYTELDLEKLDEAHHFQMAVVRRPCDTCGHHEPFNVDHGPGSVSYFMVWCSYHGGHVPAGATCARYFLPLPADE
jgi:hypothetical protein